MPTRFSLPVASQHLPPGPKSTRASGLPLGTSNYLLSEDLSLVSSGGTCSWDRALLAPYLLPPAVAPIRVVLCYYYDPFTADLAVATRHEFTAFTRQPSFDFDDLDGQIRHALATEPLLDGYTHPAEALLLSVFRKAPSSAADWMMHQVAESPDIAFAADLLRLLSRFRPQPTSWRAEIVRRALASPNLMLRDAALQAIEAWRDAELVEPLRAHREPVGWLARYAKQVLIDLER